MGRCVMTAYVKGSSDLKKKMHVKMYLSFVIADKGTFLMEEFLQSIDHLK